MSNEENLDSYNGQSLTFSMISSNLRKNGHMAIKGRPCKIVNISSSKTGKHGHTKIHVVAIDIFTGKKLEDIVPSTHNSDIPIVHRKEYQLVGVDDHREHLLLTDRDGNTKNDVAVPEGDIGQTITDLLKSGGSGFVTIISAMNEEACISVKSNVDSDYS